MQKTVFRLALAALLLALVCTGCSQAEQANDAPAAVESYLQALVKQDLNLMIAASCADWEAQAKVEHDSFAAVKLELQDLSCEEVGSDGELKLISCTGSIIANYGAEDLEIDIADRTYQVKSEGGVWRMCGYH